MGAVPAGRRGARRKTGQGLTARLALATTAVVGRLWKLTVLIDARMEGDTGTAWWGGGFLRLAFLAVLGLWLLDPKTADLRRRRSYPGTMSAAPAPGPRDAKQQQPPAQQARAQQPQEPKPKPVLIFDDPLDQQSADDTDRGWGERPSGGSGADLARFLDEKPPHHI